MATIQELFNAANGIKSETQEGMNTAQRVGGLFEGIIDYIDSHQEDWSRDTTGGTPVNLKEPLLSLNSINALPSAGNKILQYDGTDWGYIDTPTGGSGGGVSLTDVWNSLSGNDSSKQIHSSHLNVLSNYVTTDYLNGISWWGNSIVNNSVTGSLSGGINYIEFANGVRIGTDTNTNTLRVYTSSGTTANIYATGGVSALGYSSSGSGGDDQGEGVNLNAILTSVNTSQASVPTLETGMTLKYNNGNWQIAKPALSDLSNISISGPQNNQALVYENGIWKNKNVATEQGASTLAGLDDTNFSGLSNGQVLNYNGSKWVNTNFSITNSGITVGPQTYNFSNNQGTVKSIGLSMPTGFSVSGSPITDSGTFNVRFASGYSLPTTAKQNSWDTAVTNVGNLQGQMNTANNNIATLQSYFNGDKAKKAELADEAIKLQTSRYLWGNLFDGTADIGTRNTPATIDYVEDIKMTSGHPIIYMGGADIIDYNSRDGRSDLDIGFGKAGGDGGRINQTRLFGKNILIAPYDVDNKENKTALTAGIDNTVDKNPYVLVGKTLRIGDANSYFPVIYDAEKNALCFSGDIYATGGVSALGFSSTANGGAQIAGNFTVNGDVSARNNLNVANGLTVSGNAKAKSLEVGTASLTINADSGDLEISGGEEGVRINTNFYVDSEGEVTTPSITSTDLKANTIRVGDNIKIDTINGLQTKVGNTWYKLDMQAAIQAGLFTQVQ